MLQTVRPKQVRLLLAGGALGLLLIALSHVLTPRPPAPAAPRDAAGPPATPAPAAGTLAQYEAQLAQRVADLLRQVEGAGRVSVLVRLASGEEAVYLQDHDQALRRTTERDTQGGTRTIEEETENLRTVLADGDRGLRQPVPRMLQGARVEGVLIVAEGAGDPAVRLRLVRAVQALFPDVPLHRIEVLKGR